MRKLAMLGALALGSAAAPASAAIVSYGFVPINASLSYDRLDAEAISYSPSITSGVGGYFIFDTTTNSLLRFEYRVGFPPVYQSSTGPDIFPNQAVIDLFNRAGPCDLQCLVDSINASSYAINYTRNTVALNFGGALNGTVTGSGGAGVGRPIFASGGFVVTGSVPEPTTWALMLLGFGAVGTAMRRRNRLAVAA